MIHGAPEVAHLPVYFHEHLVEVPSPAARSHALNPTLPDLGGKPRPKPLPPEPDGFMADIDTALVEQVLDIAKREREPNVHHHSQADDFGAALKTFERVGFGHGRTLASAPRRLKDNPCDKTQARFAYKKRHVSGSPIKRLAFDFQEKF